MLFRTNDIQKKIVQELSAYLEAIPAQVSIWDTKVIRHLAAHPEVFSQFQKGTYQHKWDIYAGIRYPRMT